MLSAEQPMQEAGASGDGYLMIPPNDYKCTNHEDDDDDRQHSVSSFDPLAVEFGLDTQILGAHIFLNPFFRCLDTISDHDLVVQPNLERGRLCHTTKRGPFVLQLRALLP